MPRKSKTAEEMADILTPKPALVRVHPGLSSGSTLLNLACTGRHDAAFIGGNYYFLWGDSNSGKTFVCLTALAEAARAPAFDGHRLVHDNPERGAQMDIEKLFGRRMKDRLEPPFSYPDGSPGASECVEDFYANLRKLLDADRPFIYFLDSESCLTSRDESDKLKQIDKWRHAEMVGKTIERPAAEMSDGKAKAHSKGLRTIQAGLDRTGSMLIVIGQGRSKMQSAAFGDNDTHAGGHALDFYGQIVIQTKRGARETVRVRDTDRHVGDECHFKVRRSRYVGYQSKVTFSIFHESGLDDITSCIDYLAAEKHWPRSDEGVITAADFDFKGRQKALTEKIESEGLEARLSELTGAVWARVREEVNAKVGRKKRYQ